MQVKQAAQRISLVWLRQVNSFCVVNFIERIWNRGRNRQEPKPSADLLFYKAKLVLHHGRIAFARVEAVQLTGHSYGPLHLVQLSLRLLDTTMPDNSFTSDAIIAHNSIPKGGDNVRMRFLPIDRSMVVILPD